MLGAFIGDMAAWTYENDHDVFEEYLVSDKAMPSGYMFNMICVQELFGLLGSRFTCNSEYFQNFFNNLNDIDVILQAISIAWIFNSKKIMLDILETHLVYHNQDEKTCVFLLTKVIYAMRNLATKKETLALEHDGRTISDYVDKEVGKTTLCGKFASAFAIFMKANDFSEAIRMSMKLPGDRHFNAILVGAIADAMYDCQYSHTAYEGNICGYPVAGEKLEMVTTKKMRQAHSFGLKFNGKNSNAMFLPKTQWRSVDNPFQQIIFTKVQRKWLLKSTPFYYDDGLIYVYEPYVICRFALELTEKGFYRITNYQISINESTAAAKEAMLKALNSIKKFEEEYDNFCLYEGTPEEDDEV